MVPDILKDSISTLPDKPGIYKYYNLDNELIYIGKAKNLKKRVSSYFNKGNNLDTKTKRLVAQIAKIECTIVNMEYEAYLLENNLIKQHQPKYNILLKDDKTYPYIYISNERFPRVISTRKIDRSLGTFYGPFTSIKSMYNVMDLIKKLFTLRTCNYVLSEKNIKDQKFKVCLEYHIGNCKAPCVGLVEEQEYLKNIQQIQHILKGKLSLVKSSFKEAMANHATNLEFEKAQVFKEKLESLEHFHSSSQVVNPNMSNLQVITILSNTDLAVINYFKLMDGMIIATKTFDVKKKIEENDEDILETFITEICQSEPDFAKEILTNIKLENFPSEIANVNVPEIGDKRHLVELSLKNCIYQLNKPKEENSDESRASRILNTIKSDLQMTQLPTQIECFDNSNLQGTNPVAAMVCFIDAKPSKKNYRHFHIKTVLGPNDFDSMYEIVHRRYKRLVEEQIPLPQLIIIDGGKGQLGAACKALQDLGVYGQMTVIGIAKRLEEIFFPGDSEPLFISKKSETLRLIQQIRDETHRFAITFHRNTRSKNALVSELETIKGIGKHTFELLIQTYHSVSKIKDAEFEELAKLIGSKKANLLQNHFQNNQKNSVNTQND